MFKGLINKLTFTFRIRSKQVGSEAMVYARLRFNGELTTEYRVGIYVPVEVWTQKEKLAQEGHLQAKKLQLQLAHVRAQHEQILLSLQLKSESSLIPGWVIRDQWRKENLPQDTFQSGLNHVDPKTTLLDTYQAYLAYLTTRPKQDRKADKTNANYRTAGNHLLVFLTRKRQTSFLADEVTPSFGMQFYDYLREQTISADTANRYVNYIKLALHHALLYDRIGANGLFQFKPPKGDPAKRIVFLSESALTELETMRLSGIRDTVRQWALFMCYTGLDYNDAVKVVANESAYRVQTKAGDKWVYQRMKMRHAPAWGECHIPILPQADRLLA